MTEVEPAPLAAVRKSLLGILALGLAGTGAELLLLEHYEETFQMVPLVLITGGIVVVAWHAAAPSEMTVRVLQVLTLLFIVSGALGVVLHYQGNVEFELEMYPSLSGFELVQKTMTGATPVLAPGTMLLLGLIGLAHTYRHPRLQGEETTT